MVQFWSLFVTCGTNSGNIRLNMKFGLSRKPNTNQIIISNARRLKGPKKEGIL